MIEKYILKQVQGDSPIGVKVHLDTGRLVVGGLKSDFRSLEFVYIKLTVREVREVRDGSSSCVCVVPPVKMPGKGKLLYVKEEGVSRQCFDAGLEELKGEGWIVKRVKQMGRIMR